MAIEHELDEIKALLVRLGAALERLELDEAVALMTADVIILGWVGPPVVGRPAVREHYKRLLSAFAMTVSRSDVDVEILGDVAVIVQRDRDDPATERWALHPPRRASDSCVPEGRGDVAGCARDERADRAQQARQPAVTTYRSELLRRAQSRPGTIISEVA